MALQSLQILYTFVLHAEIATGRTQYKSIQNLQIWKAIFSTFYNIITVQFLLSPNCTINNKQSLSYFIDSGGKRREIDRVNKFSHFPFAKLS